MVLDELNAILASYHFRSSKRYPALLEYVVTKTLDGHSGDLKERTLGVEVFDRQPDYDTNADPVVRFSAGEIRKRIAQHYHETGEDRPLQIDLPLGSYVPEFKPRPAAPAAEPQESLPPPVLINADHAFPATGRFAFRPYARWAMGIILVLVAVGAYSLHKVSASSTADELWGPIFQSPGPVLIVIGSGHPELVTPEPAQTSLMEHMIGPYHHISLSSALALSRLTGLIQARGRNYEIKEGSATSLVDLRSRSVVLVGALNNLWTLRLLDPLRFRFSTQPLAHIEDSRNTQVQDWSVDFSKPYGSVSTDYAIVARYHDATTNGTVLVIAGIGPYGTEAASEFVTSPRSLEQLLRKAPADWQSKNLEMVLKTEVIAGEAGPPSLVAATTW
jgi:hypothetical protein